MSTKTFLAFWYKSVILFTMSGCLATMGLAQTKLQSAEAVPAITQTIDENQRITLNGGIHPFATPTADQGAAPDSLQLGRTILVLKSSADRQAALKKLLDDQQNPKSPSYHTWLTPEQFGTRFGAASQDIQKITQWLQSSGFQVEAPMAGRNLIAFSGTHAQLKAAFHTEIHAYNLNGESYFANATNPQIPAALGAVISGFSSLNNFPRHAMHTTPHLIRHDKSGWQMAPDFRSPQPSFTTTLQGQTLGVVTPFDLATIYNIKPLWDAGIDGTDQTIAIVSDSNINPADVDYFRTTFGLPPKKLNVIVYGPDPGITADESEADLDVEWAGAVAKNATIDLVVAANTATSGGIDGAAAYVINNNLASILSVSYGECELWLGTVGNQYFNLIWEQAASQGITVLVASGDSGSASCEQNQTYATSGLSVSGLASTPYNVAVGGTDFHSTYVDLNKYWNSTNDPVTLASVKGYLPESTWNDSCASPEVLSALQHVGATDVTAEALCNDPIYQANFLTTTGGSGGASNCTTDACLTGYVKPAWQSGVPGIPSDAVRDLPDVSLMSGNGLWGSFYAYCQSDKTPTGTCDVNQALQGAGGTSFATPVFAGIMALVQQKTASKVGNANYVLYKLAAAQYGGADAASCTSSTAVAGNACMFYDVTDGTIAVPCLGRSTSCTPTVSTDTYGILQGYDTGTGYDLATGLGSINAYNLVQGWSSSVATFLPSTTTLTSGGSDTTSYGSLLPVNVSVAANAPATGLPSGDVGITTNSATPNSGSVGEVTLSNGQGVVSAELLPGGTYQLFARYAGDATFAPSQSAGLTVTITPGKLSALLTASRTSVQPGQKVTFSVTAAGVKNGINPSGTIIFTDITTGVSFGSLALVQNSSPDATPVSVAYVTIAAGQLQLGTNTITASYSGDSNYAVATIAPMVVTLAGSFTTSINPVSLTMAPNTVGSVAVTVTPAGSTILTASSLAFSCPSTMPVGLACSFSAPALGTSGEITSTLTLHAVYPAFVKPSQGARTHISHRGWMGAGSIASLAGIFMLVLPRRRRPILLALTMIVFSAISFTIGCGGSASKPAMINTATTLSASPNPPTLNSPVVFTAKVAPATGTGIPTGSITYSTGTTVLGSAPLTGGTASYTTSALPIGVQNITAQYSGDSAYNSSTAVANSLDVGFSATIVVTAADTGGDKSNANLAIRVQ